MISWIIKIIVIFVMTGAITTFLGHIVHYAFHQTWMKWFYNAHMNHHKIQYPSTAFFSEKYKSAGNDSTVIPFIIAFMPVILSILLSVIFGLISLITGIMIMIGLAGWGLAHNYFHDEFHLRNSWWKRFPFFLKWQMLHFLHHCDLNVNYGIIIFEWDKLFKTYEDNSDINLHN